MSTGQGILGHNMFTYCGNAPIIRVDYDGEGWIILGIILVVGGVIISCTSSSDMRPYHKEKAKEKYNQSNVDVQKRGEPTNDESDLTAEVYHPTDKTTNIKIDDSLKVTSKYEQDAVLDIIIDSPYYSEDIFGNKSFMRAQWGAHNACYNFASSGKLGFRIMQLLSGSDNPIESSTSLDLRSTNNLLLRHKILYTVISWVY